MLLWINGGDFQDLPAWRTGVFEVLDLVLSAGQETVIAPMTLIQPQYFDEIIGRLRERGHDVRHGALLWTDDIGISEVADRIAAAAGLALAPNLDGRLRGRLRRAVVGVQHIRLD